MISLPSNFPRRVRIRGGEFGASARAMHRKAALENVSRATIERKIMSTKTTIKRVALVAVAAVGFGMLSGVSAFAAPTVAITTGYAGAGTAAGTQVTGGQSSFTYTTTDTTTTVALTGVGSVVSATGATTVPASITPGTNSFTIAAGAGNTLLITSNVAGVSTLTLTPILTGGVPGTPVTATVTWSGVVVPTLNHSTAFISSTTTPPATVDSTSLAVASGVTATPYALITVNQYSDAGTTVLATANTTAVVVSIAGAGGVSTQNNGTLVGPSATFAAGSASPANFYVYPNGVAGVGTISISVNGVVVSTKSVVFYGSLASYKLTPTNTVTAVGGADVVTVGALDANGNAAALGTYYVTSSNTAVATVPSAGQTGTTFSVTGVAVGTSTITVANAATSPTITKTYIVTVGKGSIATLTMSTDKTSYGAGEKVILTVTAKGSDGTAIGDGAYAAFSATGVTSNLSLQGALPGSSVTFAGGVATYVIYAPATSGTVTLSGTEGTATDSTTKGTVAVSFDVTNPGNDAAVDAANAATDAANYAADAADAATTAAQEATAAAQAAQDSADAATAAVVALGLRVDTLMASVRAQLTSLSNLLVRLIKKAHA